MKTNSGLTDVELFDCQRVFKNFDKDQSNSIDANELGQILRVRGLHPSNKEVEDMIRKYDTDNSGVIEFEEFIEIYKSLKGKTVSVDEVTRAFNYFDSDGSGYIDRNEFTHFLSKFGKHLSEEDIEKFFNSVDTDKDGRISLDEFKRILERN